MISRSERDFLFGDGYLVPERKCAVCSDLPRADRRKFREDLWSIPIKGTCARCFNAFVKNITGCEEPTKH